MISLTRRFALKVLATTATWFGSGAATPSKAKNLALSKENSPCNWRNLHDRVWLGEQYWANPMEDWRLQDGGAECLSRGGERSIHLLTHQVEDASGLLEMSVTVKELQKGSRPGVTGFRIGVRSDINEYRSNCFSKDGLACGIIDDELAIGEKRAGLAVKTAATEMTLHLTGRPSLQSYVISLSAKDHEGREIGAIETHVPSEAILGNVSLVHNANIKVRSNAGSRYRFFDWSIQGSALVARPNQEFGPILWSMYSLSDSRGDEGFILKMSALTPPLGEKDHKQIELQVLKDGKWTVLTKAALEPDCWTAAFRIPNWEAAKDIPYKLVYRQMYRDGSSATFERKGNIRANPTGRPLRLAALTCQNDYAFPYEPVTSNLMKLDPDMLYFSGDQIYETHGGFGIIRTPADRAILNYLRKFYQFGWAFGEAMRSRPTICIPDDHDVFQGNLWGEGGAKMGPGPKDANGGYEEPARMVNAVHRTCTGHHPDYFDPTPCQQGISVYFGEMVYGEVGFAILGDRQFKSGPGHVETGSGRADHVHDDDIDPRSLDKPGLILLGKRQEDFLQHWVEDWRGHKMKVLLSQTVFAGVATHHGSYDGYLRGDLDSGGWPQTPRDNAIRILSQGMPLHINGDQHLASLVQYGVDHQRDSCWSFCTPAIAVGYPRWWRPDEVGIAHNNRPQHGLPNTGEYLDSFGNRVYVYAVGNPVKPSKRNRYERAHQKGSGFGMVTIDTEAKTYKCEAYRFLADPTDEDSENQFSGWPLTIEQGENAGENKIS